MTAYPQLSSKWFCVFLLAMVLAGASVSAGHCASAPSSFSASKQGGSPLLPPAEGCYVGVFPGWGELEDSVDDQILSDFEQLSGKAVAITPFSNFWGENYTSRQQLDEISSYGAIPLLRLMPWGEPYWEPPGYQPNYSLQKIIDGDFDSFLADWADKVKSYGKPMMMTFGVEMNGDWFAWSGVFQGGNKTTGFGDPTQADGPERYVAAYRHIIDLFRSQGVTNVAWLFQPNHESYPNESWNSIEAYYPGDDYIDWVGASLYGAQHPSDPWVDFETLMDPIYNLLTSTFPNKPLMLPEWGVREGSDPQDKADWYTDALTMLQTKYTKIKVAIVYHERWEEDGTWVDLRINSSSAALEAYRTGISSDYFIGRWETETTQGTQTPPALPSQLVIVLVAGVSATVLVALAVFVVRRRRG